MNLLSQVPFFLLLFFFFFSIVNTSEKKNSLFFLMGGGDCQDDKSVSSPFTTTVAGSHQASHGATIIQAFATVHLAGDTWSKFAFVWV